MSSKCSKLRFVVPLVMVWVLAGEAWGQAAANRDAVAQSTRDSVAAQWPRDRVAADGTRIRLYQPQVDSWNDYTTLDFRIAAAFYEPARVEPHPAALILRATTQTDFAERTVQLFDIQLIDANFPTANETTARQLRISAEEMLPSAPQEISLDRVLAYFEPVDTEGNSAAERPLATTPVQPGGLRSTPPLILSSVEPAVLVLLDGDPIFSPIEGTDLLFVVNTNWDLFMLEGPSQYYLLNADTWLTAPDLNGPWQAAGELPGDFSRIPKNDSWVAVHENLPGRAVTGSSVSRIFTSTTPAELILIEGIPRLSPVADTELLWVTNTERDLFRHSGEGKYYFLVSGRWFVATDLTGSWSPTLGDLPVDFAAIPVDHPRSAVRASVPGTPEAKEAVMLAQVPHRAEVSRDSVTVEVTYDGDEPNFVPIDGTAVSHATNTTFDVLRVGDLYYTCFQAIWFVSSTPDGPWVVADEVAEEIYTIPPSSPKYHVTYVHVYSSTPNVVVVGHTAGYWGMYVAWGAVVYGTGYYYPPYVYYPAWYPRPVYYPYPYSYGVAAYYNPYTASFGRGAAVYGPYGGYGWGASYNARTGTYSRGAAAWGPYQAGYVRQAYNPRTDTYAGRYERATPYGSWGESVVVRGDEWVHTGRASNSRGTIRGVETSRGGRAVSGVGRNGRGFVGVDDQNNLYAGKDGNVYRRNDGGWSQAGRDGWNSVDRSTRPTDRAGTVAGERRAGDAAARRPQQTRPNVTSTRPTTSSAARNSTSRWGSRTQAVDHLNRDFRARTRGTTRTNRARTQRSSAGRGRARRGGRGRR